MAHRSPVLGSLAAPLLLGFVVGCGADQSGPVDQSSAQLTVDAGEAPSGDPPGADRGRRGFERMLEHFDENEDGTLQVSELPPGLAERLAKADSDGDGTLSKDELEAHMTQHAKERFMERDENGDGALSQEELGRRWKHVEKADTDGSGSVTFEELTTAFKNGTIHMGKHRGWRHHGGPGCGAKLGEKMFEKFDTDGDGVVQLADVPERRRDKITEADTDGDGAISKDELRAHRAAKIAAHFDKKDDNHDGVITEAEAKGHWKHLAAADANGDGQIDRSEFEAGHESGELCGPGKHGHGEWGKRGHGKHGHGKRGHEGHGKGGAAPPAAD